MAGSRRQSARLCPEWRLLSGVSVGSESRCGSRLIATGRVPRSEKSRDARPPRPPSSCCARLFSAPRLRRAEAPRPNIVLIVADDLGWADLGCYGSTYPRDARTSTRSPRRGMRFTNGYAACPVCSPSRAAILTGKYPARLHLTDWLPGRPDRPSQRLRRPPIRQHLPLEEFTLAEALEPAGYAVGQHRQVAPGRAAVLARTPGLRPEHRRHRDRLAPRRVLPVQDAQLDGPERCRVPDRPPHRRGDRLHRAEPGTARSSSTCPTTRSTSRSRPGRSIVARYRPSRRPARRSATRSTPP